MTIADACSRDRVKSDVLPFELCDGEQAGAPGMMYRALVWCAIKEADGRSPAGGVSSGSPGILAVGQGDAGVGGGGEPSGEAEAEGEEEAKEGGDGVAPADSQEGPEGGTEAETRVRESAASFPTRREGRGGTSAFASWAWWV